MVSILAEAVATTIGQTPERVQEELDFLRPEDRRVLARRPNVRAAMERIKLERVAKGSKS